ncbi:MAG TPA: hypothetical protein VJ788_03765 [Gemmatimonadota bacterium]|nr:hypothetical protein [Gemmatimonadota bacterium]
MRTIPPFCTSRAGRLTAAALALGLCVPASAQSPDPDLLAEARAIARQMAGIRGLAILRPIDFEVSDKAKVTEYARASLSEQMSPGEWEAYEALLLHTGMMPPGTDLEDLVVRLYAEQIAGYYDPARKTFYLADWLPRLLQRGVVAHEVTHALQDQHFDLERWLSAVSPTEDGALARAAVAEGDAMAAMIAFLLEPMGAGIEDLPPLSSLLEEAPPGMAAGYPTFDAAPRALQRLLLFPYVEGSDFVREALDRGGWNAVDRLYRDPPASTEQILHPDRYFDDRDEPRPVALPSDAIARGLLTEGSWGEFGTGLALAATLADTALAGVAAGGWDGDRYALSRDPGGPLRYVWVTLWDSPTMAERFADAYAQAALDRAPASARITTAEGRFDLASPERTLRLVRRGDTVEIRETSRNER